VGTYEVTPAYKIAITREGGRIFAQATGQPKVEIFPETETRFFLKVADIQIAFERDEAGNVTGLVIEQGDERAPTKKID